MRLGIDGSQLKSGGALTHLRELLASANPRAHNIESVVVWGGTDLFNCLPDRPWLHLSHQQLLDSGLVARIRWQMTSLTKLARGECDVLFVPGGSYIGSFAPFATMSRNLLPFDDTERSRYRNTRIGLRLRILEFVQRATFRRAAGTIFLTETARALVQRRTGPLGNAIVIPHGVGRAFFRDWKPTEFDISPTRPFRWIYVSIIDLYKHQPIVAEAAHILRREGYPLRVDFVGPAYPPALKQFEKVVTRLDPEGQYLNYLGAVPHSALPGLYHSADGAVFASSCENMPNTLVEAMASALPVACSDRSAMPEILGDAGVYFDPESPSEVARAMRELMDDSELRNRCAQRSRAIAQTYSWDRCARETLAYLASLNSYN